MRASFEQIKALLSQQGLCCLGAVDPVPDTADLAIYDSLLMIGPDPTAFWPAFQEAPEHDDGAPHPMDRWSERVLGAIADHVGGHAFVPHATPPYLPFLSWAKATGRVHTAPIGMLVHDVAGLWVSYRGALALPYRIGATAAPGPSPCLTCVDQPCVSACPVGAFGKTGYDTDRCHQWLDDPASDCLTRGCAARRACPISQRYGRVPAQSAFHMRSFHP